MKAVELKRLLISVAQLSPGQRAELLAALDAGGQDQEVRLLLEPRLLERRVCPHCNCSWIVRSVALQTAGAAVVQMSSAVGAPSTRSAPRRWPGCA